MAKTRENPLEPTPDAMRHMVEEAMARILEHHRTLDTQPASNHEDAEEYARSLKEPMPTEGAPIEDLLAFLFERAVPKSIHVSGPGMLAYIPGGGLFETAVADLVADAVNRYVGVRHAAPVLAQLEANVIHWFCDMVGFPAEAGGVLSSGGSMANFTAVVTARHEKLPENFLNGTLYASEQAHHSIAKAAFLAGFPEDRVRVVPVDGHCRMQADALRDAIRRDREAGFTPFMVCANAGSTNTGSVDDLQAMATLAEDEDLWLHVDAAYGGFFALTARGRERLAGIERADSVTLDPHKGLFLPFGVGSLLVRDVRTLMRTHAMHGEYMEAYYREPDPSIVSAHELSAELSRSFRGLRAWLPLKMHGVGPFRDALDEKLDLAAWTARALEDVPHVRIVAEPQLSILAFRVEPPGLDEDALDDLNRRVMDAVNARKRVFLSGTLLRGRFVIRVAVLNHRTHEERLRMLVEDVREVVKEEGP